MTTTPALPALVAALVLCAPCPAQVQAPPAPAETTQALTEQIGAHLDAYHALDQFMGAVLVAEDGEVVYEGAFGLANADWQIPNQIDTKFRLASVTKQFTAMLVLLLVEDFKLDLEAPITEYLPDYPKEIGDEITIHHLLNHTSGLPNYTARPGFMQSDTLHALSVPEFVAKYCSEPLEFEPGSRFNYSNSGYFLLGAIVEEVTGKSFWRALRERVLDPLEMTNTGFDDQYAVLANRATGYAPVLGKLHLATWINMSNPYAAGGLYSTVGDLWKWDRALRSKTLLKGELEELMFTPGKGNYGYGWNIEKRGSGETYVSHGGGINGFSTTIRRIPERGRCLVLLSNSSRARVGEAAQGIMSILDGKTPEAPSLLPDEALARTILKEGVAAGLEEFAAMPERIRERRVEQPLNQIGYQLLWQNRTDEALRIFEFNTKAFPEVANTWDSLGEAHAQVGNRELAMASYQKALELDPESTTAKPALEKLQAQ